MLPMAVRVTTMFPAYPPRRVTEQRLIRMEDITVRWTMFLLLAVKDLGLESIASKMKKKIYFYSFRTLYFTATLTFGIPMTPKMLA